MLYPKGCRWRTTIDGGDEANQKGPHRDQEVRGEHIDNMGIAPDLLEDVEPVALHDICCMGVSVRSEITRRFTYRTPSRPLGATHI